MTRTVYGSLADKCVIITGGASGIGAAIVEAFVAQNARVGFLDLNEVAGAALADRLGEKGVHPPIFFTADLTEANRIGAIVSSMKEQLGGVDVLVNNAANDDRHAMEDVTPDYWRARMAVNLDHHFFLAQAVFPFMKHAGGGSIINMGSCSWRLGLGGMPAYVTAKAAIEGLTNGLARDLGPDKIRVNCVIPGFVRTQRQVDKWLTPEVEQAVRQGQCLPDFVEPEDVAALILFLASDGARSCTSGAYTVDAGWV